ncbi:MAG: hypothetical protein CSA33_08865 [Desulfobulbus propionicus]|nr:MAG: hypothetical protein CSA33_08865 [Desulfobulbus propionicus]
MKTIKLLSRSSQQYCAIFDFDNTCIFRDIGQAVFRYQIVNLEYRLSPEAFADLLPELDGQLGGTPHASIKKALISLYTALMQRVQNGSRQEACSCPAHQQFRTLLLWYATMARKDKRLGPQFVLPLMTKLLSGFSIKELHQLTARTIAAITPEPLAEQELRTVLPGPIGTLTTTYPMGMQPFQEMRQLMADLNSIGISCNVISASTGWMVQEAVRVFGFPVREENIFGVQVQLSEDRLLTTKEKQGYPLTFRAGKVDVIQKYINKPIALIAGDADTDYEMLTLPDIRLRLIINRNQTGIISTLYQNPEYLLQGLDTSKGIFRPSRTTISS